MGPLIEGRCPRRALVGLGAAVAAIVAGCTPLDPARVHIVVEPVVQSCNTPGKEIAVRLAVHNDSRAKLKIGIDPSSHAPYALSWLSYRVLDESGAIDWKHGPGGHGPMPPHTLTIDPGDKTELVGSLYGLTPDDYTKNFKIQFKDEAGHVFMTGLFKACSLT